MESRGIVRLLLVIALVLVTATVAFAAVTFEPATGTGFVGKGDVQLIYGWNNKQLQDKAVLVQFRATDVTERSWECTNTNNQKVQERERTTTTTQLVSKIDRVRNQITGFILEGFTGTPTSSTDGPPLNSCPSGPWVLTMPAGDPVPVEGEGGLEVSIDGANWFGLE